MSGNVKFRWFLIAPLLVVLLVVVTSPSISWAGELEDAQKQVRQNPNSADAHYKDKDLLRQVEDEGEKIAIFDCQDSVGGEFSSYAQGVADIFIDIFVRSSQLSVLERSQLKLAMKELEAQKKGKFAVSDDDALNIGGTLGATKIVVCKQTKSRNKLSILARIIDVGTKNIIKSKKSKAPVESYDFLADKVAGLLLEAYTGEDLLDEEEKANIAKMDNIEDLKWASNKSQAWRESITDLSNQIISNIPPEKKPILGVIPFKDLRFDQVTPFSRILNEDIKTILARAEDLKLKEIKINEDQQPGEIAEANGLDYYVSGSYRMERTGLEVRARLIDTETSNIHGTGTVLIERKELNPEDLEFLDNMAEEFKSAQKKKSYQEQLEKLVAAKPYKSPLNVKVWTDKKKYQIGEKITFSVKAEENCYLTLLDINPQGKITVIYPNRFHRDNFIQAGVTYKVPRERDNFALDVRGPAGQERIKAIVTLNKVSLLKLDLNKGFHSVQGGTTRGLRDIQAISKKIISFDDSEWAEAYTKIVIFEKGKPYTLGSRKIPILE